MNQNRKAPKEISNQELFERLRLMKGKSYAYKGKVIKVTEVSEAGNGFIVFTDKGEMPLNEETVHVFIAESLALDSLPATQETTPSLPATNEQNKGQKVTIVSSQEAMIDEMAEDLHAIFNKIKKDPTTENMNQATTMSNTANTIGNLIKLKIMANKLNS